MNFPSGKKEKREIERTKYNMKGVISVCETEQIIMVDVIDISPLGVGVFAPPDTPNIVGKHVIIIAGPVIMYARVSRMIRRGSNSYEIGLKAEKFTNSVLQYLFVSIADSPIE